MEGEEIWEEEEQVVRPPSRKGKKNRSRHHRHYHSNQPLSSSSDGSEAYGPCSMSNDAPVADRRISVPLWSSDEERDNAS